MTDNAYSRRIKLKKMRKTLAKNKMDKRKPFQIDAIKFFKSLDVDPKNILPARRKIYLAEFYRHIEKKWSTSEFEQNLLAHELQKRMKWQLFYDSIIFGKSISLKQLNSFLETARPSLKKAEMLCRTLPKKDHAMRLGGMGAVLKAAIKAVDAIENYLKKGAIIQIPAPLIQTVFVAQLFILRHQFGKEFAKQMAEAEWHAREWVSKLR